MSGTDRDVHAGSWLSEPAPAKVNLFLHITGRRVDGYHLIDSLFVFGPGHDVLEARIADDISLEITGPFAGTLDPGDDNLVMRAACLLREAAGMANGPANKIGSRTGAILRLRKNLPVAAGVGGGSADAAAALRLLNRLWDVGFDEGELCRLGARLGADVPACVLSRPVMVRGIGDDLSPLPSRSDRSLEGLFCVLVNPGVALPTGDVFRRLREHGAGFSPPSPPIGENFSAGDWIDYLGSVCNDLEAPALSCAPLIATVLDVINRQPGCAIARLSGSGSTCFGLFEDRSDAEAAARNLAGKSGWWVIHGGFGLP